jgi:hypothetical protein
MNTMAHAVAVNNPVYEEIDPAEIARLEKEHAWIVAPIYRASTEVARMPFFTWLKEVKNVMEMKPVVTQLYYHSATFPKVMGLMLGSTPMSENFMMPFYAKHAFGEADHHQMLMCWMLRHGLISSTEEIHDVITTPETNACVNLAYQLAIEQDREKWLVAINSGIERCSNDFFKAVAPKMHALGAGDEYFDIHVSADEHHSIMGMQHLQQYEPTSRRGRQMVSKALESISLWAAMIHSWIDVECFPKFELDGSLVMRTPHEPAREQRSAA